MSRDPIYDAKLKLQEPIAFLTTLIPLADDTEVLSRIRKLRRRLDSIGANGPLVLRVLAVLRRRLPLSASAIAVGAALEGATLRSLLTVGSALNAADSRNPGNAAVTEAIYLLADTLGRRAELEACNRIVSEAMDNERPADLSSLVINGRLAKLGLEACLGQLRDCGDELARPPMSTRSLADRSLYVAAIAIKTACEVYAVSEEFTDRQVRSL